MNATLANPQRRAVRRAARTRCHAVSSQGFELLGELALDLSPRGMLVACDAPAALGESVMVSVLAPGSKPLWLDAEAEIARIIHGFRAGDPGYCVGLRFTYLERSARHELLARLSGYPPPVPRRRLTTARARFGLRPAGIGIESVALRPVVRVSPMCGSVPAGTFAAPAPTAG